MTHVWPAEGGRYLFMPAPLIAFHEPCESERKIARKNASYRLWTRRQGPEWRAAQAAYRRVWRKRQTPEKRERELVLMRARAREQRERWAARRAIDPEFDVAFRAKRCEYAKRSYAKRKAAASPAR